MIQKFKKFSTLQPEEKKLFIEAFVTLGFMRAAILTVSFKRLTKELSHHTEATENTPLSTKEQDEADRIGKTIMKAAAHTPWESACLVQSLTARKMLQKRSIAGLIFLGVTKDGEDEMKMKAHAWTRCGNCVVTGGIGHEKFTVVSVFGWGKE
jgi:hypothetical protein